MPRSSSYRLYGGEISYFTGKVRAYLRWKGLSFEEVAADAAVFRDVIVPRVGFPVIPVVVTPDDETLQDSTDVIDALERRHPAPSITPPGPVQRFVARLFELYADEWLVIPAMHYRWHHNRDWATREFGALNAPQASEEDQWDIGQKRAGPFAQAAVLLGAEPHLHGAIQASYEAFMDDMSAHLAVHPCLLGDRPSVGDFGLFGPLYAHQYRDPASGALMRRRAPRLVEWVERLRHPMPGAGDFLPDDAVPDTLHPLLRRMMAEQLPVLSQSADVLARWQADHPEEACVPRALGLHPFRLGGVEGRRIVRPYSLWMMQRARDAYRTLIGDEKVRADALLAEVGGAGFATFQDPPRLRRNGLSVAFEPAGPAAGR